ncbi:MAG: ABC transporter ATP-binding protein [Armatimonadota bacterium]
MRLTRMRGNPFIDMTDLLTIENLQVHFFLDEGIVRAVDGIDLTIPREGTVCLVGESGCGKSVAALSLLRLVASPGKIVSGKVTLHRSDGSVNLTSLPEDGTEIRRVRGGEIAMIFQEPMTSLSPVHTVGNQIEEAIILHIGRKDSRQQAIRMMERVGIPDAARRFDQYPHEMSGGLRQRTVIAMALACRPALLIADEPTTALDVTIQAQILALLRELQAEFGMSILLITHDLGVVAEMAQDVAVMYLGRIVEQAPVEQLFADPQHPYTIALLESIPGNAPRKTILKAIKGSIPDSFEHIAGCPFHPRCEEMVAGVCDNGELPQLLEVAEGHFSACLLRQKKKL